jgi:hypothetical protein
MNIRMNINIVLTDKLIDKKKDLNISGTKSPKVKFIRTINIS